MEQHILDDVVTLRSESVAFEKKKELCQPSPKDKKPPPLSFTLKKAGDVPKTTETWIDDNLPIDILLLTSVESRDFLSCFTFLDQPFKCYKKEIGVVYFGGMGDVSNQEKLKVALMNCSEGAAVPGGSLTVVLNAVKVLQPKAVFLVGTCISLGLEKARMGDVVVSSRLTTAEGFKTPGSPLLGNLVRDAPYGWDAPLKNPEEWEVKVHCNGDILSQSLRERCQNGTICEEYPTAVAIETEGEGVYAAAYDTNIEWVIVKGVASYFHQSHSTTSEWISFASTMAASVVAKMLSDPTVFREWLNYNQDTPTAPAPAPAPMRDQQDSLREYGESFVRLLIRSKHLEKEKREVIEEILTKEVEDYLKFHDHSGDNHGRAMKSFTKHLINVYCVHLVTVGAGSVFIVLDCPTLDSLELLWSDYLAGHLDEVAERCLITDETKKKLNLETICLKTTIEKENYLNCRKALVELRSLDSEDVLSDESEKFWVNIPGDYEQKKLTHFVQAAKDLCPTEMQQGIMEKFLCRIWQIDYGQLARNDSYVTLNGFLELVALFGPFKPGPDGCLQKMYDLMTNSVSKRQGKKESWFAGIMDETEAANLLCDQSPGHFLIRISSSRPHEGVFVLAVKTSDNGVVQIQIERDLKDNTLLLADKKFPDLMSIVEALRHDLLFENCSQLLTNPCPGLPLNALFTGYEVVTGRRGACGRGRQLSVSVETGVSAAALVLQECDEAGESFLSDESQKFWVNIVGDNEQKKWPEFVQAAKNCCPTEMQKGNIEDFLCRILKIDYGQLPRNERHVTRNGFLELVALFGPFKPGPHGCLQKMYDLMKQSISRGGGGNKESWFAGNMDETEAANLLGDQSPGHFLIRISSSRAWEGVFVLAVKTRVNGVVQIQIERDLQHNTLLLAGKTFPDLMSIVSVLRRDALLENCKQLLINPCPGLPLNALFTGYESATGRRRGRGRGTRLR